MWDSPRRAGERERLYAEAAETFGAALGRLARAYERDPDQRRDLLQEIHVALWRSLSRFDGRCSLRTWVYRVAHNTAIMLLYLEQLDAASIAEITGVSAANVATRVHRIKHLLMQRFHGKGHGQQR